jgi:predicted ATPase/DNA-binding winged helix-turn-helix (wHTH) protein
MATDFPLHPFRFGRFVIDAGARQVLVDGEPAKLGARAFDLLVLLVAERDRVLSKDELLERVWPGLVVEENNLQVQVSALRKLLGPAAIATIPGRGYRFTGGDAPAPAATDPPAAAPGRLPEPPGELVGRSDELQRLVALCTAQRVVTVVGPGGIGKTRLALAAGHALRGRFADGAWQVELAPLGDAGRFGTAVAQALGLALPGRREPASEVVDALHGRRALLLLDNCEHLLDAVAPFAAALEAAAPDARLLCTSQEPLRVPGEQLLRLCPLAVPAEADDPSAAGHGALALFEARVAAAQPGFAIDAGNVADAADICRRLDGLPLAIELAAARVPLLGVRGVRERLDQRFRLLTVGARGAPPRQQTLREALAWSFGLLQPDEAAVLQRAAVFVGSFGLAAAPRVLGGDDPGALDEWAVIDRLGVLVDKSLVVVDGGEPPRYRLLESTRAYALERLQAAGELAAANRRLAQAMREHFEQARAQQWRVPQPQRLQRCLADMDNLRAALDAVAQAGEAGELHVDLACASAWVWAAAGLRLEGLERVARALARIDRRTPPLLEARLRAEAAALAFPHAGADVRASLERAVALFRTAGARADLYQALAGLAVVTALAGDGAASGAAADDAAALHDPAWPAASRWPLLSARIFHLHQAGRHAECHQACEEALRVAEAAGDDSLMRVALVHLEQSAAIQGRWEEAVAIGRELVARNRRAPFARAPGVVLGNLATALTMTGRLDEALGVAREAAAANARDGLLWNFLDPIALLALRRGRVREAALALGCADARNAWRGGQREPNEQRLRDQVLATLRQALPAPALRDLLSEGGALDEQAAAAAALQD